jgi:CDP-diacylglycerol--glycerol-3-phosphate 3-phosphatidyltransferase
MAPLTWANRVTLGRILLAIPCIFLFLQLGDHPAVWKRTTAVLLFAVTAATDMLDGYLARRLHQTSLLGRYLDPLADKLLIVSAVVLVTFVGVGNSAPGAAETVLRLPVWVLLSALGKDVVVVLGTLILSLWLHQAVTQARPLGKACTCVQMVMIVVILVAPDLPTAWAELPRTIWTTAGVLAILSTLDYIVVGVRMLASRRRPVPEP